MLCIVQTFAVEIFPSAALRTSPTLMFLLLSHYSARGLLSFSARTTASLVVIGLHMFPMPRVVLISQLCQPTETAPVPATATASSSINPILVARPFFFEDLISTFVALLLRVGLQNLLPSWRQIVHNLFDSQNLNQEIISESAHVSCDALQAPRE